MNEVSYNFTLLVIFVLSASGSPSTSSKITVQGAIIRNGKKVIRGVEGNDLNIVCNIVSGIPTIKFGMNINGFKFKRVGNGSLTYHFKPSRKDNRKSFVCSAYSPLLDNPLSSRVLLDIQYAPIVNIIKKVTRKKLELICSPKGNPNSYTFDDWEHWSEFKQHIRNVKGTPENKLTFLKYNNNNSFHENDGIYKCKTSNGINDTNGRLYQKGSVLLNNKASPIFVNGNKPIQYGQYGEKTNLEVYLYNTYGTIQTTISKRNEILNIHGRQEKVQTQDMFYDINVTVSGIKITFLLTLGRIDDFTDYTITACNYWGCNVFMVKVTSNCRPESPQFVSVIPYVQYLEVVWDPGFDGGYQQTFFVEYREESENTWKRSGPVVDNRQVRLSKILNNLNPKTRYQIRVLSENEIGDSNKTDVTTVTLGE
ncbi:Hypothetical predicted protein [Mytilus galloprovincialis]|uniref:Fibronectin type-III domain-containing protein n=1 Tax=Mytilus galloprovincialis TaxID=29158 RepID=A0A8B6CXU4_MYTGA|nr:Hypothetical predicted protein [Mytilus galloprovincialis]